MATILKDPKAPASSPAQGVTGASPTRGWRQRYRKQIFAFVLAVVALVIVAVVGMALKRGNGDNVSTSPALPAVAPQSEGVAPAAPISAEKPASLADKPAVDVLKFENPLKLYEAGKAGKVTIGSVVQVSGVYNAFEEMPPNSNTSWIILIFYIPDPKKIGASSLMGAYNLGGIRIDCTAPAGQTLNTQRFRTGDTITVRGTVKELPPRIGYALGDLINCAIVR